MTRRTFLITPVALVAPPALITPATAQASIFLELGELIIIVFEKIFDVALGILIESAARYIWNHFINPSPPATSVARVNYYSAPQAQPLFEYIERGHAADNFCPYCTVEFVPRGKNIGTDHYLSPTRITISIVNLQNQQIRCWLK